ncbi:MAG: hypothetical protein IPM26_08440 [Saprospiraceae bacterium]|nr:hypothetical protein [Saprospiraceae bacterium]
MLSFRFFLPAVLFTGLAFCAVAQNKASSQQWVPSVFFIGEHEHAFEKLVKDYNTLLFTVCDNSMELTHDNWTLFLKDIENFAATQNVDLKGTKYWFNVFWNKDGTIDHIAFYPKPNSRNMNYEDIKVMLTNFVRVYQSPIKSKSKFSHYGSASFPIFTKASLAKEK